MMKYLMQTFNASAFYEGGNVLCLGAHCDDIEIGCAATLLEWMERYPKLRFKFITFCAESSRKEESLGALNALFGEKCQWSAEFGDFKDGLLPYDEPARAKTFLANSMRQEDPLVIITHCREDRHQDHRFVSDVTYQIFRNHLIFEMEIPKYDGDLGPRNLYVPVSQEAAQAKIDAVVNYYRSQNTKDWFNEDTFRSLMTLRGLEVKSPSGLAEAFSCRKMILD